MTGSVPPLKTYVTSAMLKPIHPLMYEATDPASTLREVPSSSPNTLIEVPTSGATNEGIFPFFLLVHPDMIHSGDFLPTTSKEVSL